MPLEDRHDITIDCRIERCSGCGDAVCSTHDKLLITVISRTEQLGETKRYFCCGLCNAIWVVAFMGEKSKELRIDPEWSPVLKNFANELIKLRALLRKEEDK